MIKNWIKIETTCKSNLFFSKSFTSTMTKWLKNLLRKYKSIVNAPQITDHGSAA
jgi:hypothetical protein